MNVRFTVAVAAFVSLWLVPAAQASSLGSGVTVERAADTGLVNMIGTKPGATIARPADLPAAAGARQTALAYADELGPRLGVTGGADDLKVSGVAPSIAGGKTVRLQQKIDGLPVIGGELQANLDSSGRLTSLSGEGEADTPPSSAAKITPGEAQKAAVAAVAKHYEVDASTLQAGDATLAILDSRILGGPGMGQPELVYEVEVGDTGEVQSIRDLVAVDAQVGFVAVRIPEIEQAKQRFVCDAGNTATKVPCNAPYVRTEGGAATGDPDIDGAYDLRL